MSNATRPTIYYSVVVINLSDLKIDRENIDAYRSKNDELIILFICVYERIHRCTI